MCRVEANNNRKAVVVGARHVVKRPSKRSALVMVKEHDVKTRNTIIWMIKGTTIEKHLKRPAQTFA